MAETGLVKLPTHHFQSIGTKFAYIRVPKKIHFSTKNQK